MQDKYGVEINVGDIVEYMGPNDLSTKTNGTVTNVSHGYISALWEDTQREQTVMISSYLTVVKPAASILAEQTVGFTQEDEAMLQMLLKRKQDHEEKIKNILENFADALSDISYSDYHELYALFKDKQNATKFCDTIKAYHEIN